MKNSKRFLAALLSIMLTIATVFAVAGCGNGNEPTNVATETEVTIVGEGETKFPFIVVDKDGNATNFEVYTDKEIVGEALLEVELIAGEESEYGLFVKTVNGITADYNVDKVYWAFYVDGEYALSGVDTTVIEEGMTYTFKVEK